jgi:hypothetical protein
MLESLEYAFFALKTGKLSSFSEVINNMTLDYNY